MPWAVAAVLLLLQGLWLPAMAQADFASLSQDEKMARRFPQLVRVGDLIGLPVLDDQDSTIGYTSDVVRTPDGRVKLIVPYRRWFAGRTQARRCADRDGGDPRPPPQCTRVSASFVRQGRRRSSPRRRRQSAATRSSRSRSAGDDRDLGDDDARNELSGWLLLHREGASSWIMNHGRRSRRGRSSRRASGQSSR